MVILISPGKNDWANPFMKSMLAYTKDQCDNWLSLRSLVTKFDFELILGIPLIIWRKFSPYELDQYLDWVLEGFKERAWPMYLSSPINPDRATTRFEWARGGDWPAALGVAYSAREMFR